MIAAASEDAPGLAPLFEPANVGGLALANRVAMAPMTRWKSPGQVPGRDVAAYYARRAAAGVGLIVTEGTTVEHPVASYSLRVPAFHRPALYGWTRVADAVHAEGGKIVPQLWHVGAMRSPSQDIPNPELPALSPSGMLRPGGRQVARIMDEADIAAVADAFARAAQAARTCGFDGVEIHGAHGYLLDQFLWDELNLRSDDDWGGDAVGRTRFAALVVARVRAAVGKDFPLILRISQWKQQAYGAKLGATPKALGAVLAPLTAAGVDIYHCSQRRWWQPEFEGSPLNLAGWVRQLTGRPTITVGSVGLAGELSTRDIGEQVVANDDLEPLAARLAAGEFDLVAVGRALLADPQWLEKLRTGRAAEIVRFDREALELLS